MSGTRRRAESDPRLLGTYSFLLHRRLGRLTRVNQAVAVEINAIEVLLRAEEFAARDEAVAVPVHFPEPERTAGRPWGNPRVKVSRVGAVVHDRDWSLVDHAEKVVANACQCHEFHGRSLRNGPR